MLVGEDSAISYYGDGHNELHLLFNFPLMRTDRLTPAWVRANQRGRLAALPPGAWPCNTLGNHDSSRVWTHFGDGQNDAALARLSLALMLTLRGTPFLYYGEEIGMADYLFTDAGKFRDSLGQMIYQLEVQLLKAPPGEAAVHAANVGRDKCRTPMQWTRAANAGFSPAGVETWLPVNPNYAQGVNVEEQWADPHSLLRFYQSLLHVRRQTPALVSGDYTPVHDAAADYLALLRRSTADGQTCLVLLNMSGRTQRLCFRGPDLAGDDGPSTAGPVAARRIFSSHVREGDMDNLAELALAPYEVYIGQL
jgi:alpha-glucosidase